MYTNQTTLLLVIDQVISENNTNTKAYNEWYTLISLLLRGTRSPYVSAIPEDALLFTVHITNDLLEKYPLLLNYVNGELISRGLQEFTPQISRFHPHPDYGTN